MTPLELEAALTRLDASDLSQRGKQHIRRMLEAASNPNAEAPDVVIKTLEPERQANIERAMAAVGGVFVGAMTRGGSALMQMSDSEWQRLVDESENR